MAMDRVAGDDGAHVADQDRRRGAHADSLDDRAKLRIDAAASSRPSGTNSSFSLAAVGSGQLVKSFGWKR